MIITSEIKLTKTLDSLRSIEANHRPSVECNSFTEEPISLSPGSSSDLSCEKGLILVSPDSFQLTGDISMIVSRFFACFSKVSVSITNDVNNTSDLEVHAYIFN